MNSILRTWTFWIHAVDQQDCRADMKVHVLEPMRQAPGNQRASAVFHDTGDAKFEVVVLSVWDSMKCIQEFFGSDYVRPMIAPEHQSRVFDLEPTVRHYRMTSEPLWLQDLESN
jgi:heme-degrading monooxygenase HmoA